MPKRVVEFDFFAMEEKKETPAANNTRTTFSGIITAISKIHPSATEHQSIYFLSAQSPPLIRSDFENKDNVAPLTIFYNGTVTVAHLTSQKAERILKIALDSDQVTGSSHQQWSPETLSGARRRSLAIFLQTRKERLKSESALRTSKITYHP